MHCAARLAACSLLLAGCAGLMPTIGPTKAELEEAVARPEIAGVIPLSLAGSRSGSSSGTDGKKSCRWLPCTGRGYGWTPGSAGRGQN